mmetsp:Transcript_13370/g.28404  ORF Transcript_13370/g.28404 Transcript_13370/m.28404 type:complete len:309 (-) Transcript_13370:270-1196(-)
MDSKGIFIACIVLGVASLAVPAMAGGHSISLSTRTAHLALNLVDMRCPSQFEKLFVQSKAALIGQGRGRRHLLGDGEADDEFFLEDEEDQTLDGSRHLLGAPGAKMTLKAYRESARASAVAKAHEVCNGAPDDKGPAVFFPLHLDLDVSNEPLAKPDADAGAAGAAGAADAADAAGGEAVAGASAVGDALAAVGGEGDAAAAGPAEGESEEGGSEDGEEAEEEGDKKDKKKKKKKKDEDEDEDEAAQVVDTGPSVLMVIFLLMLVGSGIGIAGYKYLNSKTSNEAPLSERASNIKKQLTRMQNALENS